MPHHNRAGNKGRATIVSAQDGVVGLVVVDREGTLMGGQECDLSPDIQINPRYKVHQVVLLTNLPRTASGKLIGRKLRSNHAALEE